jgi:hypothetical protein
MIIFIQGERDCLSSNRSVFSAGGALWCFRKIIFHPTNGLMAGTENLKEILYHLMFMYMWWK